MKQQKTSIRKLKLWLDIDFSLEHIYLDFSILHCIFQLHQNNHSNIIVALLPHVRSGCHRLLACVVFCGWRCDVWRHHCVAHLLPCWIPEHNQADESQQESQRHWLTLSSACKQTNRWPRYQTSVSSTGSRDVTWGHERGVGFCLPVLFLLCSLLAQIHQNYFFKIQYKCEINNSG